MRIPGGRGALKPSYDSPGHPGVCGPAPVSHSEKALFVWTLSSRRTQLIPMIPPPPPSQSATTRLPHPPPGFDAAALTGDEGHAEVSGSGIARLYYGIIVQCCAGAHLNEVRALAEQHFQTHTHPPGWKMKSIFFVCIFFSIFFFTCPQRCNSSPGPLLPVWFWVINVWNLQLHLSSYLTNFSWRDATEVLLHQMWAGPKQADRSGISK